MLDRPLGWGEVAAVARGAHLDLSASAGARIEAAHAIVRAIVARGVRAYGVNTGVGALSEVVIPPGEQGALSRNILMSHAAGVGPPLPEPEVRAIMAAMINMFALGRSGLRLALVERVIALLNARVWPQAPRQGSVGYLSHRAHISLVLIGCGRAVLDGELSPARDALARLGLEPLVLEAKEGLSLVNGTACAAGLGSLVMDRARRLMAWADAIAAMTLETQGAQLSAFETAAMALHASPGISLVANSLQTWLEGSGLSAAAQGRRVQDALSLRSVPHVHGAVWDVWTATGAVLDRELQSATDNPAVFGTPAAPVAVSQAHAVGAALGLALDQMGTAIAELGMISERRLDRMVNPLVSGLPPFLAETSGVASGFMIAQYTASSLAAENRRLAAPASLDGGVTSGLQEDLLCHATPSALKALDILVNTQAILAIELLAACQSYDLLESATAPATRTAKLYAALRRRVAPYRDDRPLGDDIAAAAAFLEAYTPSDILDGQLAGDVGGASSGSKTSA